jgi:hypothetical protein
MWIGEGFAKKSSNTSSPGLRRLLSVKKNELLNFSPGVEELIIFLNT